MGHKDKASTNYSGGDSPKRLYLSPSTRTISPGIKESSVPTRATRPSGSPRSWLMFLPYAIAIFGVAFLASAITASIVTPVQNSDAIGTEVLIDNTPVSYYVNIATNSGGASTISRDVYSTIAGTLGVITDTLRINSNTPNGYFVYLSAASGHNQYLTNEDPEYSSYHINPISGNGTVDNTQPVSLTNPGNLGTANTWGVAVADTYNAVFDAASAYASDSIITQTTKFAPIPAYGSEERLITRTGDTRNSGAGTIDTIPVYYGFHTNSSLPAGTYSDTVLYTAYAEATDQASGVATATYVTGPNGVGELSYKTGGVLTLTTSLYTDRTLSTSDATVTLTNNTTNESSNCPITSIGQVQKGTNDSIRIVCTAPIQSKPGTYTVRISIPGYAHNSIASVEYTSPGIVIASGTHAGTYKTMQAMTSDICHDWDDGLSGTANWDSTDGKNQPKPWTRDNDDGYYKPEWRYGTDLSFRQIFTDLQASNNWSTVLETQYVTSDSAITNINAVVPETYLQDNRDGNYYRVRKLADGNCWMTENLRLVFYSDDATADGYAQVGIVSSDGTTITPSMNSNTPIAITTDNTDISSNITAQAFGASIAKTEVNGVMGVDYTVWGAEPNKKHSTSTSSCANDDDDCSTNSMQYSRSYYNNATNLTLAEDDIQIAGTYYNWKAATAGVGDSAVVSNPDDSICPKGWQIPTVNNNKSYNDIIINIYGGRAYNDSNNIYGAVEGNAVSDGFRRKVLGSRVYALAQTIRRTPFSLPLSGAYTNHSASTASIGTSGDFWQRVTVTSSLGARAYFLGINSSNVSIQGGNWKGRGYSVRCVAR